MEWAKEFLEAYRYVIYTVIVLLLTVIILRQWWEKIKFWAMCTWMEFPVIGKIASLSKDIETMDDKNWFYSESTLCGDFYKYYNKEGDASLYEKSKSYLSKVDELGRKPFPFYMGFVISILVILEALGFGYVLAGFTLPGASESLQQQGAFGIALILSILLVWLTHATGHQIYRNSLLKKARIWFNNDRNDNKPKLEPDNTVSLDYDYKDDQKPNYTKLVNRIKEVNATVTPSWIITIFTVVFIVCVAIGATYVRGQVLEKQLTAEVNNQQTNVFSNLPSTLTKVQEKADHKALEDSQDSDRKGGRATFVILAIIFVFIQLLGILFGYKFGFAGKESDKAYKNSFAFSTKQEFINYFKREKEVIAKIAQQKLQKLQQKMAHKVTTVGISAKQSEIIKKRENRTFLNYVQIQNRENVQHEANMKSAYVEPQEAQTVVFTETLLCSNCNTPLDKEVKFCPNCGTSTIQKEKVPTCPQCGKVYANGIKFCAEDGQALELK